ncbi:hypothetical protein MLD38_016572 [Melastoma candidum]|uniref:Uncharacterized protein n=1 Tax=Melastoma candidum TaxID=119954 RepID=A0ACB9QM29_9MYRT|nr:hypothetical protein MLD38_016572 [Melastoma candidum]
MMRSESEPVGEFLVLTGFGHGHLFPFMELCNRIAFHNRRATFVVFSHLYSSIHPSFLENPLVQVVQVHSPSPRPGLPRNLQLEIYEKLAETVEGLLSRSPRPVCALVNTLMLLNWTKEIFKRFGVPIAALSVSGACSPCMEVASYKARAETIGQGEVRPLPGLPEEMALSVVNIKRRPFGPPTPTAGNSKGAGAP